MGCPKCTTRFWRAASRSLMTSCCVAGSFLHLSLSSESTRDSTVASSRESKSCRCVLKRELHFGFGMSKVAKLAEDAVGALGVESTDAWSCAQLRMTVASSRNRNVLNLSSQATLCFSPILGIVDRKDESGQSNPITRSYKTIQNMDSQA